MKIAITGATGLVGSRVLQLIGDDFECISLSSQQVDITDKNQVNKTLGAINYDMLLHFAGYTNVDKAEHEKKELCFKLNVEGTQNLFDLTQEKGANFIYISTGFVFDGTSPPYSEESTPHPINQYGESKYQGEKIVGDNGMIVRIEYPYGNSPAPKKDFARTIKSLLEQGKTLQMVENARMTPTFIDDIALSLKYLLKNYSKEVFHIVGAQSLSAYECGKLIAKTFNLDENLIQPTTYEKYFLGKAQRPQWAEIISKKNSFHRMKPFDPSYLFF